MNEVVSKFDTSGDITFTVRSRKQCDDCFAHFLCHPPWEDVSTSVSAVETTSSKYSTRLISQVILDSFRLLINTNDHRFSLKLGFFPAITAKEKKKVRFCDFSGDILWERSKFCLNFRVKNRHRD